jgi:hypothetical protein
MADARTDTATDSVVYNQDVDWDQFPPELYWHHNYVRLREDDEAILETVAEFFSGYFESHPRLQPAHGLDVGSGPNLYPTLGMLPWVDSVTLTDHSAANVEWLQQHIAADVAAPAVEWPWQPFWKTYTKYPGYEPDTDARSWLAGRCQVEHMSVFDLPFHRYDIGTMFFVAESMTSDEPEFEQATKNFLDALQPGSPFAAAFMDKSEGYLVGRKTFPAVRQVDRALVESTLVKKFNAAAEVKKIPIPGHDPLRKGYDGMIIAVGTTEA